MKKKQYFRTIPKDASDQQALLQKIVDEGLLPEPEETDGLVFVERIVLFTNQAIRKNSKGETQNPTRTAGTGSRDQTLVGSFQKGIDIREMPPKVIKCDLGLKLYGGFGRHEIFDDLEYEVWIYDVYRESGKSLSPINIYLFLPKCISLNTDIFDLLVLTHPTLLPSNMCLLVEIFFFLTFWK